MMSSSVLSFLSFFFSSLPFSLSFWDRPVVVVDSASVGSLRERPMPTPLVMATSLRGEWEVVIEAKSSNPNATQVNTAASKSSRGPAEKPDSRPTVASWLSTKITVNSLSDSRKRVLSANTWRSVQLSPSFFLLVFLSSSSLWVLSNSSSAS